jgi:serine protease Do
MALSMALTLVAAAPAAFAEGPLEAFEEAQEKLFEQVAPSVVHITGKQGTGTGFFVNSDGLILTNEHVVRGAENVQVITLDGKKHRGSVVATGGKKADLALVKVSVKRRALKLADLRDVRVGSWVGAVGHGWGGVWAYTTGIVSNVYPSGDARPVFQTQIPLNPGNSGGPVFDRQGRVVGIVTWGIERANNINFAITSEVAMFTFSEIPVTCDCLIVTAPDGLPIFVDEKMAGKGPGLLIHARPGATYEIFVVKNGKMDKRKVQFPNLRRVEF